MQPNGKLLGFILITLLLAPEVRAQSPEIVQVTHQELKAFISKSPATLNVVNFWATWCVPCRQEFPDLVKVGQNYANRGVNVIFVSTDFEEDLPQARTFLAEHRVSGKTFVKKGDDQEFINAFHQLWSGALPATFIYGKGATLETFWEGKATYEELTTRLDNLLQKPGSK